MGRIFSEAEQGYYHVFNRGVDKKVIFIDQGDYERFLFLLLYLQGDFVIKNLQREFVQHRVLHKLNVSSLCKEFEKDICKDRQVEIVNFCIMPNHFHLTVHELQKGGLSKYMHRLLNSYSKFFNTKYERNGHAFQGAYKSVVILHDNQLSYTSAYIHHNPKELQGWNQNPEEYAWSSYQDYIGENRWGNLLKPEIILEKHSSKKDYFDMVSSSGAKDDREEFKWVND